MGGVFDRPANHSSRMTLLDCSVNVELSLKALAAKMQRKLTSFSASSSMSGHKFSGEM